MATERDLLLKAQELIKKKKYAEARTLLRTIPNNPTSQKWLTKLEEIAPEFGDPFPQQTKSQEKKKSGGCYQYLVGTVVVLFIIAYLAAQGVKTSTTTPSSSVASSTRAYGTSRDNPVPAGGRGAVQDGEFSTEAIYTDMTNVVKDMNMFNPSPDPGQAWALARVGFDCELESAKTCAVSAMDIRLVGKLGKLYNKQIVAVIEHEFKGEIYGGNHISGLVGFIVDQQDGDFRVVVDELLRGRTYFAVKEESWTGS